MKIVNRGCRLIFSVSTLHVSQSPFSKNHRIIKVREDH